MRILPARRAVATGLLALSLTAVMQAIVE